MYSKIKCIGLCHGVFMTRGDLAHILGRAPETLDVYAAGMNHFQWVLALRDKETGEDLYPELIEKEKSFDPAFRPLHPQNVPYLRSVADLLGRPSGRVPGLRL